MKKQTTTIGKGSIFFSHLNQFLLLDVAAGVVVVLLAGAGHLHPLLTSVTVLLPTRLTVRLLLETIGMAKAIE